MNEEKRKFVLMYLLRLDLHQMRIEYIRRSNDIIYQYLDMYSIEYAKIRPSSPGNDFVLHPFGYNFLFKIYLQIFFCYVKRSCYQTQ